MAKLSSKGSGAGLAAAVAGLLAFMVFYGLFSFGLVGAVLIGLLVAVIVWIVLWLGWGEGRPEEGRSTAARAAPADPVEEMNTGTTTGAEFIEDAPEADETRPQDPPQGRPR
ncbi:hypothetical protein [Thalassorhabdomicrobium marinisediminis]|uniref:Uncharacterized protein n=1 Tax=Thalassorhabdomicrobium marinisediminis TaxID=2170577 RepID=A0A2T7G0K6_9RHOB|nr:hypothetical protein [Thalassorhabdomicrobium marinisediminis]PVA07963.1 hypothetical protein DC363_00215 [Thalassorhabdomicrobium marinisediminis]